MSQNHRASLVCSGSEKEPARRFGPTIGSRACGIAYLGCIALLLVACDDAAPNRESLPPPPPAVAPHAPTSPPIAAADTAGRAETQADSSRRLTTNGEFGYLTEQFDEGLLSMWREADPTTYSGTYAGEWGDGGTRLVVVVRRAPGGGYEVSGAVQSVGIGESQRPTAFGPVPLHLNGHARFDAAGQRVTFLHFDSPERGVLKGLLLEGDELFCEKEE
jgi:hypothetical protein